MLRGLDIALEVGLRVQRGSNDILENVSRDCMRHVPASDRSESTINDIVSGIAFYLGEAQGRIVSETEINQVVRKLLAKRRND